MTIDEMIEDYKNLTIEMDEIKDKRKALEIQILSMIDVDPSVGQKTYTLLNNQKFMVHGGHTKSLDQELASHLIDGFNESTNPIVKKIEYKLDASVYKRLDAYPELKMKVDEAIIMTPKAIRLEVL